MNTNTQKGMNYFKLALAGLLRHRDPDGLAKHKDTFTAKIKVMK